MTLEEIKAAVDAGKTVHWENKGYTVVKGRVGYLIVFAYNDSATNLTRRDGVTMNEREEDFFLGDDAPLKGHEGNDDQLNGVLPTPVGQLENGADPGLNVG